MLLCSSSMALGQVVYDGTLLGASNKWDSYPTHLYVNGVHHIWWCGTSSVSGSLEPYVDGIFHATKSGSLGPGGWSARTEVFNHTQSPWSTNHVCDPSVVRGSFGFQGSTYAYALYWTADTNATTPGVDNEVGVAFSNDGVNWTPRSTSIIGTYGTPNGSYGAGAGGAAFGPNGTLHYAYDDSTLSPQSRTSSSTDGINFSPAPPYATQLKAAGRNQFANSSDIAYNSLDGHWYAIVQTWDPAGNYSGEARILKSVSANDLRGQWKVVGLFNSSVTGLTTHNNPGLGKNADSTLYVDANGRAYAFFGAGDVNNPGTWQVAQGRFYPGVAPSEVLVKPGATASNLLVVTSTGGTVGATRSPVSATVSIGGGTTANSDNLWNAQDDYLSKPGFDAFVASGSENASRVAITIEGLDNGLSYNVHGRFGTAVLQSAPNYYGIEMGLSAGSLSRYDQTTGGTYVMTQNWSNWQEREYSLGLATVVDGKITLYIDDDSVTKTAAWTGFRLVKQ